MKTALIVLQLVFAVLLSISVLLQSKGGVGLSDTFGGSGNVYSTKRGAEKVLFSASIVLSVLFILNTLAFAFVR